MECYRRAIEINPKYTLAHLNLGSAFDKLKKYNKALTSINMALEIDPKCADAHCHLGIVLGYMGKYNEAIESLRMPLKSILKTQLLTKV